MDINSQIENALYIYEKEFVILRLRWNRPQYENTLLVVSSYAESFDSEVIVDISEAPLTWSFRSVQQHLMTFLCGHYHMHIRMEFFGISSRFEATSI